MENSTPYFDRLYMKDPWLSFIQCEVITVFGKEGSVQKYKNWLGKTILLYNENSKVHVKVISVRHYRSIKEFLYNEDDNKYAPHYVGDYKLIKKEYNKMNTDDDIERLGGFNSLYVMVLPK